GERGRRCRHLTCGLVGERDRQDLPRADPALRHQVGHPAGQHPGLARAGPGHDEQRAALVHDGGALLRVQVLEEGIAGGDGHVPSVSGDAHASRPPRGPVRAPCRPPAGRGGPPSVGGGGPVGRARGAGWGPLGSPPVSPLAGVRIGHRVLVAATATLLRTHTVLAQNRAIRNCFRRILPKSLPVQWSRGPFARIVRMRILLVGAGGVGTAFAQIAARREFADLVVADYDLPRAQHAAAAKDGYRAVRLDARDEQATASLLTEHDCDVLMNATDPRFVMPRFRAALAAGAHYLDMAMSLSHPHPDEPYAKAGVKLGDEQFAMAQEWERSGRLALVGIGVEPGLSDVFARHAADTLFHEISDIGVRDGANLAVAGYDFAPTFSIWTTIEECL